jgi:hypothetical protein
MSAYPHRMSAELMGKLQELAERRQAHFHDLHESGRWKHYYSEPEMADLMDEAGRMADHWRQLAAD